MEHSATPTDWTKLRRKREPVVETRVSSGILCIEVYEEPIDERATLLFSRLPYACRLSATRSRFPHVLNRLAAHWENPKGFREASDDLLVDRRGGRQGFPAETVQELHTLRRWYEQQVEPRLQRAAARTPSPAC